MEQDRRVTTHANACGGGPRSALHASWSHAGYGEMRDVLVAPLDVVMEGVASSGRWGDAVGALSAAYVDAGAKAMAAEAAERRRVRRAAAAANDPTGSEAEFEPREGPPDVAGAHRVLDLGYLWQPPATAHALVALRERVMTVAVLYCLVAAAATAPAPVAQRITAVQVSAVLSASLLGTEPQASAGVPTPATRGLGTRVDRTAGVGPLAVAARLKALVAAGLTAEVPLGPHAHGAAGSSSHSSAHHKHAQDAFVLSEAALAAALAALHLGASPAAAGAATTPKASGGSAEAEEGSSLALPAHLLAPLVSVSSARLVSALHQVCAQAAGTAPAPQAGAAAASDTEAAGNDVASTAALAHMLPLKFSKPWRGQGGLDEPEPAAGGAAAAGGDGGGPHHLLHALLPTVALD
jgi:hypothetical protein